MPARAQATVSAARARTGPPELVCLQCTANLAPHEFSHGVAAFGARPCGCRRAAQRYGSVGAEDDLRGVAEDQRRLVLATRSTAAVLGVDHALAAEWALSQPELDARWLIVAASAHGSLTRLVPTMSAMAMAIELARFTVKEGANDRLLAGRGAMIQALRARFPGCLAAYLTREDDGGWLDIVLWRSRREAEEAAREVNSVPECAAWFEHIATSGGLRHVDVVDAWST